MNTAMPNALRILGMLVLMTACGGAAAGAAVTFLMNLGLKLHNNYEYYGGNPGLLFALACGAIGFFTPGLVAWHLRKHSWQVSLRTLLVAMFVVTALVGIYSLSL
jgi:hypothetical protein